MECRNKLMPTEGRRIHPILQHYEWLEYGKEEPLDFTHLSEPLPKTPFRWKPSELSQLPNVDKKYVLENLTPLELIFWALEDEIVQNLIADKNRKTLDECYEAVRKGEHIVKHTRLNVEQRTGITSVAA